MLQEGHFAIGTSGPPAGDFALTGRARANSSSAIYFQKPRAGHGAGIVHEFRVESHPILEFARIVDRKCNSTVLLVRLGPNARISIAVLAVIVVIVVLHKIDLVPENAANATEAFYEL